jgi:hypothetical protein
MFRQKQKIMMMKFIKYRVIHDLWTLLQEMIFWVFMIKKVNVSIGHILNSYRVRSVCLIVVNVLL